MKRMATGRPSARDQARRGDGQVSRVVGLEAVEEVRPGARLEEERPSGATRPGSRPRRMRAARPSPEVRTGRRQLARTARARVRDDHGHRCFPSPRPRQSDRRQLRAWLPRVRDGARGPGLRAPWPHDARIRAPGLAPEPTGSRALPKGARLSATGRSDASAQCTHGRERGEWRPGALFPVLHAMGAPAVGLCCARKRAIAACSVPTARCPARRVRPGRLTAAAAKRPHSYTMGAARLVSVSAGAALSAADLSHGPDAVESPPRQSRRRAARNCYR